MCAEVLFNYHEAGFNITKGSDSMKFKNAGRIREYWEKLMRSTQKHLSEGSLHISRIIPYAHKDCWRRKDKVQPGHQKKHK